MNNVSDGDIILMHDLYSSSREAAKRIIPELKKKGYQLVTVSELAEYKKVKLSAGERYSRIKGKSKAKTTACVQWVPALHPAITVAQEKRWQITGV